RVIEPGEIYAGDDLVLLKRPHPDWSIAACHEVMHYDYENLNRLYELSKCNAIGSYWKEILKRKLRGKEINEQDRLLFPKKKVGVVQVNNVVVIVLIILVVNIVYVSLSTVRMILT